MANNVMEVITGIVGELKSIASAESIIGQAVTVGGKTVIPVVKVTVGFGAGGGEGEKQETGGGFGAGGGGGAIVEPAAFIIMDETGISLLPAKPGKIDSLVEAIPGVVNKLVKIKNKLQKSDNGDADSTDTGEAEE
ncbi:MAG: sporulation protein [candidate division Zixibacteria bacterium]|nr:sporulation protein [candidate division Zixibacteria bacterium]